MFDNLKIIIKKNKKIKILRLILRIIFIRQPFI